MVGLSRLAGGGLLLLLLLALLPLALDGKPLPYVLLKPPPDLLTLPQALRISGYTRPNSKQSQAAWAYMVHPKPNAGGGGYGDWRPLQHLLKSQPRDGCFGLKLDSVGTRSGLGCKGSWPVPKPAPGSGF